MFIETGLYPDIVNNSGNVGNSVLLDELHYYGGGHLAFTLDNCTDCSLDVRVGQFSGRSEVDLKAFWCLRCTEIIKVAPCFSLKNALVEKYSFVLKD